MSEQFLIDKAKEEKLNDTGASTLVELQRKVDFYTEVESRISALEEELKQQKALFEKVSTEDIPALLLSTGLSEVKLADGRKIKVTEQQFAKVKDKSKFLEFLKSRGEDSIVKLQIKFERMSADERRRLEEILSDYNYLMDEDVHYQTLQKYFRELLGSNLNDEEKQNGLERGALLPEQVVSDFAEIFTSFKTTIK